MAKSMLGGSTAKISESAKIASKKNGAKQSDLCFIIMVSPFSFHFVNRPRVSRLKLVDLSPNPLQLEVRRLAKMHKNSAPPHVNR